VSFAIGRRFSFAAAHHLDGLAPDHKCGRVHGHSYTVEVELASGELDATGFVADFGALNPLGRYIGAELDHRDLNEVLAVQPSCENIACYLFGWCRDNLPAGHLVSAVRVSESSASWAEYRSGGSARTMPADRG